MAKTTAKRKPKEPSRAKAPVRKSSARRPIKATAKAKPKARKRRKQAFVATHFKEGDFKEGLRRYAQYRDLGIAAATKGLAVAHVIKLIPPCVP